MSITRLVPGATVGALVSSMILALNSQTAFGEMPAMVTTLSGSARIIDGDTIEISGRRVRLEGIDAPEMSQICRRQTHAWHAGREARQRLLEWTKKRTVACSITGVGTYGRRLGHCRTKDRNLNAGLVRAGLAWAFRKYSTSYVEQERTARAAGAGIWSAQCRTAWDFRHHRWQNVADAVPAGCAIKGNITQRGRIYHMPWSRWWSRTQIEPDKGERWFCNEQQARAAGWRPAIVN